MNNKELLVAALDGLIMNRDLTAVDKYWSPDEYPNHNPDAVSGTPEFREMARQMMVENPDFRAERYRVLADGDFVAAHSRYWGWGPDPFVAWDVFRVADGRLLEHWDCLQIEASPNPSGRTMIDGPVEADESADSEESRHVVQGFLDDVMLGGNPAAMGSYFDGDNYLQHNPGVGDGVSALAVAASSGFTYGKAHRLIADGDLVLVQGEGAMQGVPNLFYDLFRVQGGVIAEHWDVMQPIRESTADGLPML